MKVALIFVSAVLCLFLGRIGWATAFDSTSEGSDGIGAAQSEGSQDDLFDCSDFDGQEEAQEQLVDGDPYGLDEDGNGLACDGEGEDAIPTSRDGEDEQYAEDLSSEEDTQYDQAQSADASASDAEEDPSDLQISSEEYQYTTAEDSGSTLMEAGGPGGGPAPKLPNGGCPVEFPIEEDSGCFR